MKKVLGWILVVCGVMSLPGFLMKLGHANDGYEVIGMLIGQGLIFFLAYLCLRNKTSEPESESQNITTETLDTSKTSEDSPFIPISEINTESVGTSIKDDSVCMQKVQNDTQTIEVSIKDHLVIESSTKCNETDSDAECLNNFPKIDYTSTSWEEIESYLFEYQKEELLEKCNPSIFMNPYNHDKVEISNSIIIKVGDATCLEDLRELRGMVISLGVEISTSQIFDYLTTVCNPINYIGTKDLFTSVNNIYSRILESKNNMMELEKILEQAEGVIPLSRNEEVPAITEAKEPISKSKIAVLLICGTWACVHCIMWIYKGVMYNATSYFFPFQTLNLAKYDFTEFIIYGIIVPSIVLGVGMLITNFKK